MSMSIMNMSIMSMSIMSMSRMRFVICVLTLTLVLTVDTLGHGSGYDVLFVCLFFNVFWGQSMLILLPVFGFGCTAAINFF